MKMTKNPMTKVFEDCVLNLQQFKEHSPLEWQDYQLRLGLEDSIFLDTLSRIRPSAEQKIILFANKVKSPWMKWKYSPIKITMGNMIDGFTTKIKIDFGRFSIGYINTEVISGPRIFSKNKVYGILSNNMILKPYHIRKMLKDIFNIKWVCRTGDDYMELLE